MRHEDLDFLHDAYLCDDCWDRQVQTDTLHELKIANQLKLRELDMREGNEWVEEKPRPRPRQTYVLPPTPQPARPAAESLQTRGGINIDPAK